MFVRAISVEPPEYEIGLASKTDEKKTEKNDHSKNTHRGYGIGSLGFVNYLPRIVVRCVQFYPKLNVVSGVEFLLVVEINLFNTTN